MRKVPGGFTKPLKAGVTASKRQQGRVESDLLYLPIDIRRVLAIEKDLRNTMKAMERDGLLRRIAVGCYVVSERAE